MTLLFAALLFVHGLIHLLGVVKAWRLADLPQLSQTISPMLGWLWLAASLLFGAAAICLVLYPRRWWFIAGFAVVLSMAAIVPSWGDAKYGAVANLVVLAAVIVGFLTHGPTSLEAAYQREVAGMGEPFQPPITVADGDLAGLPLPIQRYLRVAGVVGHPRVVNFRVRMHGRIRSGPTSRWMPFTAEQHNVVETAPARLFYMSATMFGIPFQILHRYLGGSASMAVKLAAIVPVAEARGVEMTRTETVTLFNDMCIMAPATLIDPKIEWQPVDDVTVRAIFRNAGHTIHAELSFNEAGELTNFSSHDRGKASADGKTLTPAMWSTPIERSRAFGQARLASAGAGRWHEPSGEYNYIELELDDVHYNVTAEQ